MVLSVILISMKLPSLTYRINVLIVNPDKTSDVAPLCNKKINICNICVESH